MIGKFRFIARRLVGGQPAQQAVQPYPGSVVLFKSSVRTPSLIDAPLGGWAKHVTGNIEVLTVVGDHTTTFKEPGVQELAAKLSVVLKDIRDLELSSKETSP